jgi:hypothetical protein
LTQNVYAIFHIFSWSLTDLHPINALGPTLTHSSVQPCGATIAMQSVQRNESIYFLGPTSTHPSVQPCGATIAMQSVQRNESDDANYIRPKFRSKAENYKRVNFILFYWNNMYNKVFRDLDLEQAERADFRLGFVIWFFGAH